MVSMGSPAGPCVPGVSTALSPEPCAAGCLCGPDLPLLLLLGTRTDPPSPELGVLQGHIPTMEQHPGEC